MDIEFMGIFEFLGIIILDCQLARAKKLLSGLGKRQTPSFLNRESFLTARSYMAANNKTNE